MSIFSLTCDEILFLAMSILRHTTFGSGLLVVPDIFGVFLLFRVTFIFGMSIFSRVVFSRSSRHAGWQVASPYSDIWQLQIVTCGIIIAWACGGPLLEDVWCVLWEKQGVYFIGDKLAFGVGMVELRWKLNCSLLLHSLFTHHYTLPCAFLYPFLSPQSMHITSSQHTCLPLPLPHVPLSSTCIPIF